MTCGTNTDGFREKGDFLVGKSESPHKSGRLKNVKRRTYNVQPLDLELST